MAKNRYQPIDLAGLTEILRAHATQISPPGMRKIVNAYLSRSDNAITIRKDLSQQITNMAAVSADLAGGNYPEYLQGIYYAAAAGGYLYFSNFLPFSFESLVRADLADIYSEGTITTSGTDAIVIGTGTEFLKYAWKGCLIRKSGTDTLYQIVAVKSDLYIVTSPAMPAYSGVEYEILRTHTVADEAWPIKFQKLGTLLVYNPANPTFPNDVPAISGPFYADVGRPDLFGVWREFEPDITFDAGNIGILTVSENQRRPRYGNSPLIRYPTFIGGEKGFLAVQKAWLAEQISYRPSIDTAPIRAGWPPFQEISEYESQSYFQKYAGYIQESLPSDEVAKLAVPYPGKIVALAQAGGLLYIGFEDGTFYTGTKAPSWASNLDNSYPEIETFAGPYDAMPNGGKLRGVAEYIAFGDGGQFYYEGAGLITTNTDADLLAFCYGDDVNNPVGSTTWILVGGIDSVSSEAIIIRFDNDTFSFSTISSGVTADLTACFYLHAYDPTSSTGRYVALGDQGVCVYSDDGALNFSVGSTTGLPRPIKAISDNEGRCAMVICEEGVVAVTENGLDYTVLSAPPSPISLQEYPELLASGSTWGPFQSRYGTDPPEIELIDLDFDDSRGQFVISWREVGSQEISVSRISRSLELPSPDNLNTETATCEIMGGITYPDYRQRDNAFLDICWTGSNFVAVGDGIWVSADGDSWTEKVAFDAAAKDEFYTGVAHDGSGNVLAVGKDGVMTYSTDHGATWNVKYDFGANTVLKSGTAHDDLVSLVFDDYNFIVVGGENVLQVDPSTWAVTAQTFDFTENLIAIAYAGHMKYLPSRGVAPDDVQTVSYFFNLVAVSATGRIFNYANEAGDGAYPSPASPTYDATGWEEYLLAVNSKDCPLSWVWPFDQRGLSWATYNSLRGLSRYNYGSDVPRWFSLGTRNQTPTVSGYLSNTSPGSGVGFDALESGKVSIPYFKAMTKHGFTDVDRFFSGLIFNFNGRHLTVSSDHGTTWSKWNSIYFDDAGDISPLPIFTYEYSGGQYREFRLAPNREIADRNFTAGPCCSDGTYIYLLARSTKSDEAINDGADDFFYFWPRLFKFDPADLQMVYRVVPNGIPLSETTQISATGPTITLSVDAAVVS